MYTHRTRCRKYWRNLLLINRKLRELNRKSCTFVKPLDSHVDNYHLYTCTVGRWGAAQDKNQPRRTRPPNRSALSHHRSSLQLLAAASSWRVVRTLYRLSTDVNLTTIIVSLNHKPSSVCLAFFECSWRRLLAYILWNKRCLYTFMFFICCFHSHWRLLVLLITQMVSQNIIIC